MPDPSPPSSRPGTNTIVRPATSADVAVLGRLGALLVGLHHQYDADRFIAPTADTERAYGDFLVSRLDCANTLVLVAEEGRAVLGYSYAGLEGNDWMSLRGPAGVIYDLVVEPQRRRAGIGTRLLEATSTVLADLGAPRIVLATAERNDNAQRLFAAAGFRRTMIEMTRDVSVRL